MFSMCITAFLIYFHKLSIIFQRLNDKGWVIFLLTCKFYGKVSGTTNKEEEKAVRLYIGRVNGIAYYYDMFKSYKEMEINALQ